MNSITTLLLSLVIGICVAIAIVIYLLIKEYIRSTAETLNNKNFDEVIDFVFEVIGWRINKIAEWWNNHFYK